MSEQIENPAIVVLNGEMASHNWILDKDELVLGRDDSCDIVIPQRQISRQHLVFRRMNEGKFYLEDLESKNGTWLNGNRVEDVPMKLSDGDERQQALHKRIVELASVSCVHTAYSTQR